MEKVRMNLKGLMMVASVLIFSGLFAQDGDGNKSDRIEALRVAYISKELNLTPAEAQKFWPVYNQYRDEMRTLRASYKSAPGELNADQKLDFEQKKLDIKKKYKVQFESSVGKEKCNQLYGLEEKFRQQLKDLRDQRQQMKGDRPGMGRGGR